VAQFVDECNLHAKAGDGGAGSVAFRREAHVAKGGPDGGDGGRGGDVWLVADHNVASLLSFKDQPFRRGGDGTHGAGKRRHGTSGDDILVPVPEGTVVRDHGEGTVLADLVRAGDRYLAAEGGRGGRGNARFLSNRRRAPAFAEQGEQGEERWLRLELKLLADVALVGFPNVGKSTLISRISAAKPKVADYPFTTLEPHLGVVRMDDGAEYVVADVPGLIEGASEGVGLGHAFLAHLERARVLLHVIDASEGDSEERFRTIDAELALYGAGLDERPQAIVLNKVDLLAGAPSFQLSDPRIVAVHTVSAVTGEGVEDLKRWLFSAVPHEEEAPQEDELPEFLEYRPQPPARRPYRVYRTDRGYRIAGEAPRGKALEEALQAAGIRKGQEVEVGDESMIWE
jgi:GTP-binding protein